MKIGQVGQKNYLRKGDFSGNFGPILAVQKNINGRLNMVANVPVWQCFLVGSNWLVSADIPKFCRQNIRVFYQLLYGIPPSAGAGHLISLIYSRSYDHCSYWRIHFVYFFARL
jgi:hypothetical protein